MAGWDAVRRESPEASQVILAYTRDDVRDLNELARGRMRASGALRGADQVVQTELGARAFAAGRPGHVSRRNERGLGSRCRRGEGGCGGEERHARHGAGGGRPSRRAADGAAGRGGTAGGDGAGGKRRTVTFDLRAYGHVDHGYAATVHKAQGVTVDRAHVLATPHMDRHAAYVGLTRHRDGVALHYAREDFASPAALARVLGRERAKDITLDYDRDGEDLVRRYAERRGLAPDSQIVVRPPLALEPEKAAPSRRSRFDGFTPGAGLAERPASAAEPAKAAPVPAPGLAETVATGRAGFRERFEAHRRQQAQARDEAAARELVGQWDRVLTAYNAALPKLEADPALDGTREQLAQFGRGVREQPGAARVLREQGGAFGMSERPNLARIVADREPERVVAGIMAKAEGRDARATPGSGRAGDSPAARRTRPAATGRACPTGAEAQPWPVDGHVRAEGK